MSPPHPRTDGTSGPFDASGPCDADGASDHAHIAVDHDVSGDVLTIRVAGAIDADTCPDLETALGSATDPAVRRTVLDLSGVDFADSSALHVLLTAQREHRAAGREMLVAGPFSASLYRLFTVTGTDAFFTLLDSPSLLRPDARDGCGRHVGRERPDGERTARQDGAQRWQT